jgi:tRNA A-37 threonylcarbamoyl transferase component Bud32
MDQSYALYCLASPYFYDSPTHSRGDDVDFDVGKQQVPAGWTRTSVDDWLVYMPEGVDLPAQGWKIHASARLDDADDVLNRAFDYCIERRIPFKFIRSKQLLFLRNVKWADRRASGKFVTIYPVDERQLETVLIELGVRLDGLRGPYILSDLRWGEGPLYVRYGGFTERYCTGADGEPVLAIADPDGMLVPDRRDPAFSPPPWVELPEFLAPSLAARDGATIDGLPYRIERALHFSNGGGVYGGVDVRTGAQVVLKEARPWAGLVLDGSDAVTRLRHERDILRHLQGLDAVPKLRDYFTVGEHHFLVLDRVEGTLLNTLLVERFPLTARDPDEATRDDYAAWALDVAGRVEAAVETIHQRGIVIGDVHPSNVLVQPDGRVLLIDFEVATDAATDRRQMLADPAFIAPEGVTGFALDRHALACLRLFLFMPLTTLLAINRSKATELAADIADVFPSVPAKFLAEAATTITGSDPSSAARVAGWTGGTERDTIEPDGPGWLRTRQSLAEAILLSATPERDDRLFPGDISQFSEGGLNVAHGAAGVLYALHMTGAGASAAHEEWLLQRALRPDPGTRIGFFDGLHGVAYVLERMGRLAEALKVVELCVDDVGGRWDRLGTDLYAGLAGIGLNLAHFANATGDVRLWEAAWQAAEAVADRLGDEDGVGTVSGGERPYAGLTRGSSGPALMFLRLYEHRRDNALLDLAATALRQDLRRCYVRDDGSLEVNEGWRTMPYVADGSAGIGLVLDEYLRHREDEHFFDAGRAIRRAARACFYIEPGLFYGRAGMILYLTHTMSPGTGAEELVVAAHVRRLAWHVMSYRGRLAFPGEQLLRLSMDLATGGAGVLLALGAALHECPVHLPFLAPVVPGGGGVDDFHSASERR